MSNRRLCHHIVGLKLELSLSNLGFRGASFFPSLLHSCTVECRSLIVLLRPTGQSESGENPLVAQVNCLNLVVDAHTQANQRH